MPGKSQSMTIEDVQLLYRLVFYLDQAEAEGLPRSDQTN